MRCGKRGGRKDEAGRTKGGEVTKDGGGEQRRSKEGEATAQDVGLGVWEEKSDASVGAVMIRA